jgi:hypothetical protein
MSRAKQEAFLKGISWAILQGDLEDMTIQQFGDAAKECYPDSPCTNVREIVAAVVKADYHGLYNPVQHCECLIGTNDACTDCVKGDCRPGILKDGKIVERE